jgi:hypothetical protein
MTARSPMAREYITMDQARRQYGLTTAALNNAVGEDSIRTRISGGKTMLHRADVRALLKQIKPPTPPAPVSAEAERSSLSTRHRLDERLAELGRRPSGGTY